MLSLRSIKRICAAIDAVAITFIAANLRRTLSAAASPSSTSPDNNFPKISKLKNRTLKSKISVSEPALIQIQSERNPTKLFNLLVSNSHNRVVVENRFVFQDAVSRFAGARRFDLIEKLLEQQRTLPQRKREGFVVRIISLYGRAGMPDHALKVFNEMHLYGCSRTVKSFNAVLKVLFDSRRFVDACKGFDEMPERFGIELDDVSYNTMVKGLCEMGLLERAGLVMAEMERKGIEPDVVTYTTLMSMAYKCGRQEIGNGLWNLMVLKGCKPNVATFNVRIQYLINRRRGWQANDLMWKMEGAGVKPDELTFNLIIKGFCVMGEFEMAKRVFFALSRRECKPNRRIYQTMVHYMLKAGEFDLAFKLLKESMERNWFPSLDTISNLLKCLASISKDKEARRILKLIRGRMPPYSAEEIQAFESALSQKECSI